MARIYKKDIQKQTDDLKILLLSGQDIRIPLADLYNLLRIYAKHRWIIEVYQLLSLYTENKESLYHPALLQAFISLKLLEPAKQIAQVLATQNPHDPETCKFLKSLQVRTSSTLPDYTPLAHLSRYAQSRPGPKTRAARQLPSKWSLLLSTITPQKLQDLGYYAKCKQLRRAPKTYQQTLLETFDELILNYLFQNNRSCVSLAGALLETLLAIHVQQAFHLQQASFGKQTKDIFDCNLNELLLLCSHHKALPDNTLRLCRAARMQRNFIHPGKEITEKSRLAPTGAHICFLAVQETIDTVFPIKAK